MKGFTYSKDYKLRDFKSCVTFNFPYVDSDLWGTDILFNKLRPETWVWI